MQAIINGEMYEVEPAVKVIIDKLMIENAELRKENARLEELYQKSVGVIAATDCVECQAWIDASIKLPDDDGDVLVWYQCKCCGQTSQSWGITFCSRHDWYKKHLDGECINILFWHKLPKPPIRECETKTDCEECKRDVALDYGISNNIAALRFVLDQYQKIIVEITHGRLSKLTYPAETILSIASEAATDCVKCKDKAVKHAYWIKTASPYHVKCSNCKTMLCIKFHGVKIHKFCQNCGAKMDGESE